MRIAPIITKGLGILLCLIFSISLLVGGAVLAWAIPLPRYLDGRYIPRDLQGADAELIKHLPRAELQHIRDMKSPREMIQYHFSLGMGLRNGWGLWRGSRLSRRLNLMGLVHPDDMSVAILEGLWYKLHNQPYRDLEHPKAEYRVAALVFMFLAAWLFFLFRWWHRHLCALAERYDMAQRRRKAGWHYLIVAILMMAPIVAVLLTLLFQTAVSSVLILVGFLLAVTPATIWWWPRMAILKSLGYGRQPWEPQ